MNATLAKLQDQLLKVHSKMRGQLKKTDDVAQQQALLGEMVEVTHRIQLVSSQLFKEGSAALDKKAAAVKVATAKVNAAIEKIQKLTSFLKTMTSFLGLVDEVIDLAKALAFA